MKIKCYIKQMINGVTNNIEVINFSEKEIEFIKYSKFENDSNIDLFLNYSKIIERNFSNISKYEKEIFTYQVISYNRELSNNEVNIVTTLKECVCLLKDEIPLIQNIICKFEILSNLSKEYTIFSDIEN